MSKVLIPFIDHAAINHKFYLRVQLADGRVKSTCYWSGIYPNLNISDNMKCAKLAENLLCYDTCLITIDDFLFLVNTLGIDIVNSLINEGALEVYNNNGMKAAITNMSDNDPFIINFSFNKTFDPEEYIREYQRIYNIQYDDKVVNCMTTLLSSTSFINVEESWIKNLNNEITNDLSNPLIIKNIGLVNDGSIIKCHGKFR